jgi:serine-type D-Ala-D-Ala carboxypeptidase
VEKEIIDYMNAGNTYAFIILAARYGIVCLHKVFGKASHEAGAPPLQANTIFPMSSITKPVTATAVMILYEEGKLDIHKPVWYYVPEFTGEDKDKTLVWHLLSHISGIADETIWDWYDKNKDNIKTPAPEKNQSADMAGYLYPGYIAPLWKKPGVEMSYCNYNANLLGEIIRRVSGQSYEGFVKERILEPLGMKNSYMPVPLEVRSRLIRRPPVDGNDWYTDPRRLDSAYPAAGMYSIADDMAVFCQMYLNKGTYGGVRIISPESVREMTRNQIPGICSHFNDEFFPEAGWGYGWDVPFGKGTSGNLCSAEAFTHGGSGGVIIFADPHFDLLWVRFCVHADPEPRPITGKLSDMILEAVEF